MKFSYFFIERPIFAMVISIVIVIAGLLAYFSLPTAQYPEIAPPTVQVTATFRCGPQGSRRNRCNAD